MVYSLDGLDILADLDRAANHFMTNAERKWNLAPSSANRMHVRGAYSASIDGDIDVAVLKRLELKLGGGQRSSFKSGHSIINDEPLAS